MLEPIPLEDLALLEVLQHIGQTDGASLADAAMRTRLIEGGLAEEDERGVHLTHAGIALCKALQHRVHADKLAQEVVRQRTATGTGE